MKIIAFYLPQFHNIPENDEWWGDGFTEWTNVKKAYPIYNGQKQPKVPLNNNYYNLLDDNVKIWQANIAKEHGIYGFCYYHYWFDGHMLLEKPMEQMLANKKVDIPFCVCWANETWTKAWVGNEKKVLIPQRYGGEKEWKEHFDYLLPFLKDERYIRKDGKPIIIIYRPLSIPCLEDMLCCWKKLAVQAGLSGLCVMCTTSDTHIEDSTNYNVFDNIIEWQPHTAKSVKKKNEEGLVGEVKKIRREFLISLEEKFGIDFYRYSPIRKIKKKLNLSMSGQFQDYDAVWKRIIDMKPLSVNSIPGAFVHWDNTPRYEEKATVIRGDSPEKFEHYMELQIKHARNQYHSDMMFMYAWNEWAEGGYLEPDEDNGYAYLEAIKTALKNTGEFPDYKRE